MKSERTAFGRPGIDPRWTRSDKDAIVTAYSASSRIWVTLSAGIVNEVYFPSIDTPQIRDLQFLITDGETFFHDERRDTDSEIRRIDGDALGFVVTNKDREGRYAIEKRVITAPHAACLLVETKFTVAPLWRGRLKLFALLAPHLGVCGLGNHGLVERIGERMLLTAHRGDNHLAMDCSSGFVRGSCGYVGSSDGWTDLADNMAMEWEFDSAPDGNIALTGEVDLSDSAEFVLALSLSENRHGAMIASMSIPWGEAKGDEDLGGYHLVWTRDLVNSATGLMAAGETATPLRALIYTASSQKEDGGFYQNFWIDGRPYWQGTQLDEVAFPILLAWRLKLADGLQQFDPYPMVRAAAGYLVREGPATPQERWEENSGYSPSTLAAQISALVCANCFARERGDEQLANHFVEYADFLHQHLLRWTVTDCGTILPDVPRHFIRMLPIDLSNPCRNEDPNSAEITIRNRAGDLRSRFPARQVVDAGFLELVRFGVLSAGNSLIGDSLKVIDHDLKVETPNGPCWRRYSYDGYGQRADGGPFVGVGQGRAWPLLTGERGHYELAGGRDVKSFVKALEQFAGPTGLLPEQIWDEPDLPEARMRFGRPTGSAMPLMWAHAEYIKLLRSVRDGAVFDRIDAVYDRYCGDASTQRPMEIWKFSRQAATIRRDETLRVQTEAAFRLRWTTDNWQTVNDADSLSPGLGIHCVDLPPISEGNRHFTFTFRWPDSNRWEGRDFSIECQ